MTGSSSSGLPAADAASLEHSRRVAAHIRRACLAGGGSIGFAAFMQLALYAPGLGYYVAGTQKFGAGGDFTTAPETSRLFGRVLARHCGRVLRDLQADEMLELGAGSGALAVDVLGTLAEQGIELSRYAILEVSADLRQRQEARIRAELPGMLPKVEWLARPPHEFTGVVLANEVADALPVERFRKERGEVFEYRVAPAGDGFAWRVAPARDFLRAAVAGIEDALDAPLPDAYVSEVCTALPGWVGELSAGLRRGLVFVFDYGLRRREYYAPDRSGGWLRCHFRHRAHDDPLVLPGIQDLSAWVDFTALAEAAVAAGLEVASYCSQADYLLHAGLADELAGSAALSTAAQLELARQAKILTLPGEMGEHFKCMVLGRDAAPPAVLAAIDKAHTL